ncbi:MAG: hypothetical protein PHV57_07195 [Methanomicrobiaceae archaeon]|nr:hypothetical protein [Methanomicrobiaceae archaeon]
MEATKPKKGIPTGYIDTDIWWTCPECSTRNFGIYYSRRARCAECAYEHPKVGEMAAAQRFELEAGAALADEVRRLKARIERLDELRESQQAEVSETERQLEAARKELAELRAELRSSRSGGRLNGPAATGLNGICRGFGGIPHIPKEPASLPASRSMPKRCSSGGSNTLTYKVREVQQMIKKLLDRNRCPCCGIIPELILLGGVCVGVTLSVLVLVISG